MTRLSLAHWWQEASSVAGEISSQDGCLPVQWYRFARAVLGVACDDEAFRGRFQTIFAECACPSEVAQNLPQVRLELRTKPELGLSLASFAEPEPLDPVAFTVRLFPERQYVEVPTGQPGWRMLAAAGNPGTPVMGFRGTQILVDRSHAWQSVIAHYAVNDAMRLQKDVLFFHAASVAIADHGVLITGPKGAGKTTLSLALAARNHGFLGDEYAAVAADSGQMLPFRRAASIRPGPRPSQLDQYLRNHEGKLESGADGSVRVRASVAEIFPAARPRAVRLTHAFFLRQFSPRPLAEGFTPGGRHLSLLVPYLCTVWAVEPGRRAVEFLNLLANTRCFYLDAGGSPEETAELIEKTVEGQWDSQCGKKQSVSAPTAGWKFS